MLYKNQQVHVSRWLSQESRPRQRQKVHVPLVSPSLRSCCTCGASRSRMIRQARRPLLPACGRVARSARRCTPRPSRRFAMRTIEQCALTILGTIVYILFLCASLHPRLCPRSFPSFWIGTAPFSLLPFDATGKSCMLEAVVICSQ